MAQSVSTPLAAQAPVTPVVSARGVAPYAILFGLLAVLALYFVGAEQGATALFSGTAIHEYVHDARHLMGFPCH
ncbi:cobalt transporter subunit CbtB [Mumia flava]|uniref:Cobalt transporter subunit CbtB n=1 Tax=Mumia flava TaxID=1348852 RepID=A0A0B2BVT5_9ACTN|nr:CbtB-domain containing protein [Mumia flava]PJJ58020.1 cobalt transporter subunit CbtB [Mumia flava]